MGGSHSTPISDIDDTDPFWKNAPSSSYTYDENEDMWWTPTNEPKQINENVTEKIDEFKLEFERKHEKRRAIIAEKRQEMQQLRKEVQRLKAENEILKKNTNSSETISILQRENIEMREKLMILDGLTEKNRLLNICIAEIQNELQNLNVEVLNFEKEKAEYKSHVAALKDVIKASKEMLLIKDNQLKELKLKIDEIEKTIADGEVKALSNDIRTEYERQLENMKRLRSLYEERQAAHRKEKQEMRTMINDKTRDLELEEKRNQELQERIDELTNENSNKYDEIKSLESNFGLAKAESRQYQAELTVINQLFSEILLGFNNGQELDIDKLIKHLEENHDLIQNIVFKEESNESASALPKVLLALVSEISDKKENTSPKLETIIEESESPTSSLHQLNSAEEIVEILPKVWRVLIELLSHQCAPVNIIDDKNTTDPCYKTIQTPKGPNLVLSVSQTFIRLKDLILEKKSLEKETCHLKQLNGHLENRLQDQEKRLEMVSKELSKTWHVVGKLQKQHELLHTQEKILRHELAQKRKLLNELKEELEYSREKWLEAREKNSTIEQQCQELRMEFASRKIASEENNNSVESGYSDDEPGYETDISECNQKVDGDNSIILGVIQDEIADIEKCEKTEVKTLDEIWEARQERLARLEGQCQSLVEKVTNTTNKSVIISNRLENLHEIYGEHSGNGSQTNDENQHE